MQILLTLIWYSTLLKFHFKGIAIDYLKESATQISVDFHCSTYNLICSIVSIVSHIISV